MPNINSAPYRIENGATIEVTTGGTTYTLLNLKPGTIRFKPAFTERIEYMDRGVQQAPLDGDQMRGEAELEINAGPMQGSDSLYALLMTAGSSGASKLFTSLVVKQPPYRGGSTGESITFSNFYLSEPPEFRAAGSGQEWNSVSFKVKFTSGPTIGTY